MQIKTSRKHVFICLLLCSIFLCGYASVLNVNGSVFSDINVFDGSSLSGGTYGSAMSSGINAGPADYMTSGITSEYFAFSVKAARLPNIKTTVNILTAIISALIIRLIYSSRLTNIICTQFDSIQITEFLHKKDGMK
ncbi:MAG: hypothetical protein ACM3PE_08870 [Deltaproteobacteria bacterium]